MTRLKFIFPLMGVVFIGLWFFKVINNFEGGSIQALSNAQTKYQYLALLGFGCFWVYPAMNWFRSGPKINIPEISSTIRESVYPTYGRAIPIWAHILRITSFAAFIYFSIGAIEIYNDELSFNWHKYFPVAIGALVYFALPLILPRKAP